jgi:hypothetical protein
MGQTRFAPITLKMNATFMMLKSAKKSRAYGKKQRRMMNSKCRPKYKKGFDGRLSAWPCQIFNSCWGRSPARRCRCHPVARKLAMAPKSSRPVCVQAQDSKQGTDESWTATTASFISNFAPSRTIESHRESGNRTIDKQRFEVPLSWRPFFQRDSPH